jgi:hypothetical protein
MTHSENGTGNGSEISGLLSSTPKRKGSPAIRKRILERRLPAALATIALARLPRMKALLASFQQTTTHPRPAGQSRRPATLLIFGLACSTLGRAHGR